MTWIKSFLQRPDGRPLEGVCVTAILHAQPGWRADRTGQILGQATTHTDATGLWRLNLVPYTEFEPTIEPYVYYTVDEGRTPLSVIRVPFVADPSVELWLRDVLVDPPSPQERWSPIDTLGHLQNVDVSVDQAPEGSALVVSGGMWTGEPLQLKQLGDVDQPSLKAAQPGDVLELLPDGLWGVSGSRPATLTFVILPIDPDFSPEEQRLTILSRDPDKTVHVEWGDGHGEDIPLKYDYAEHIYPGCGVYYPTVSYTDGSESHDDFVSIPCEEVLPVSTPTLTFRPHPSKARTLMVRYDGYTDRHVISFGDGKTQIRSGGETATSDYDSAGRYRVQAWTIGMTEVLAAIQVRVMDDINPVFGTFAPDPTNGDFYQITWANDGSGIASQVDIDWGSGGVETVWATPGGTVERDLPHGQQAITIKDHASLRSTTSTHQITGRVGDPDATIELDPADKTKMTVKITLKAVDATKGAVQVWWDQGVKDEIAKPTKGASLTHKYTVADTYPVVVEYKDPAYSDTGTSDLIDVGAT